MMPSLLPYTDDVFAYLSQLSGEGVPIRRTINPYHREPEPAGVYLARKERQRKDKDERALDSGKIGAKRRRRIARREARRAGK